jgi:hypothetical protein
MVKRSSDEAGGTGRAPGDPPAGAGMWSRRARRETGGARSSRDPFRTMVLESRASCFPFSAARDDCANPGRARPGPTGSDAGELERRARSSGG